MHHGEKICLKTLQVTLGPPVVGNNYVQRRKNWPCIKAQSCCSLAIATKGDKND
jgi:hypothetical protein